MSAARNALKSEGQKITNTITAKHGRVKHGEKPEIDFLLPIPSASFADQNLAFRTIQTSRSMGIQNILILREQLPSVALVIGVCIPEDSRVQTVRRLTQSKKVTSAMLACLEVIENELSLGESTGNESGTKSNLIKVNLPTDGKRSGV